MSLHDALADVGAGRPALRVWEEIRGARTGERASGSRVPCSRRLEICQLQGRWVQPSASPYASELWDPLSRETTIPGLCRGSRQPSALASITERMSPLYSS